MGGVLVCSSVVPGGCAPELMGGSVANGSARDSAVDLSSQKEETQGIFLRILETPASDPDSLNQATRVQTERRASNVTQPDLNGGHLNSQQSGLPQPRHCEEGAPATDAAILVWKP
jgi:hypothetical protein